MMYYTQSRLLTPLITEVQVEARSDDLVGNTAKAVYKLVLWTAVHEKGISFVQKLRCVIRKLNGYRNHWVREVVAKLNTVLIAVN